MESFKAERLKFASLQGEKQGGVEGIRVEGLGFEVRV